jgi:hypothetical protein
MYCPSEGCLWRGPRPRDFKLTSKKKTSLRRINLLRRREMIQMKYTTQRSLRSRSSTILRLMRWCGIIEGSRKVYGFGQVDVGPGSWTRPVHCTIWRGISLRPKLRPVNTLQFIFWEAHISHARELDAAGWQDLSLFQCRRGGATKAVYENATQGATWYPSSRTWPRSRCWPAGRLLVLSYATVFTTGAP